MTNHTNPYKSYSSDMVDGERGEGENNYLHKQKDFKRVGRILFKNKTSKIKSFPNNRKSSRRFFRKGEWEKIMVNESITDDIVRDHFLKDELIKKVNLERQIPKNPRIKKLLQNSSKKGNSHGRPDFIITFKEIPRLLIVIECKANIKKHISKNEDKYMDYAVDGVKLYSQYLSREFDVISIAVSGENVEELKVSSFLQLEDEEIRDLKIKKLFSLKDYIKKFKQDEEREKIEYEKLMKYSRTLNNYFREELKVSEKDRALLVSGILLALDDNGFRKAYPEQESSEFLAEFLLEAIEKRLKKEKIPEGKRNSMIRNYSFIKDLSIIKNRKENKLYDLINQIHKKVHFFVEDYKFNYDVIGSFYGEFLRYANGDKSLGIVLTPRHITELFVEIANVKKDDVIYDNCCGTGGFLISSMKKMIQDSEGDSDEIRNIQKERLIGIEADGKMFTLGCANMILMKDGKSNFYNEDGLKLSNQIYKKYKPTVGFLNPPYSQKRPASEFDFILANLEALEKNSLCIAIVPISCALKKHPLKEKLLEKHTLEAVMSMPDQLFYPIGTMPCIMVFRAKKPHPSSFESWFGHWKDDGFSKVKHLGRIDLNKRWDKIKKDWVEMFLNRKEIDGKSLKKIVSFEDEWSVEAYMKTSFKEFRKKDFIKKIHDFVSFEFGVNNILEIENKPKKDEDYKLLNRKWKYFNYDELFENILRGKRLTEKDRESGSTLYFSASEFNNGHTDNISNPLFIEKDSIIYTTFGDAYYIKGNFTASDEISIFKHKKLNVYNGLFISTVISKNKYKYYFGRKAFQNKFIKDSIALPIDESGEPDWSFMEDYIKSLPYSKNLEN